ncbi:phosphoribosylanthranilate isomerase [Anoxybacillus calidus]|uniref:N-(5'-phosphoribosyl)anthranilate isomerase n=1 Tax=[Anoxybacillus] calidus TaxID=575178 RepID=A0A7V9YXC1_9BACL|nr:phosphoribosylanthranilate isomerase [Anoxybacillus calidus]MBA2870182.1 phosphoribosylanthranilate isomerase [Anoxybacillus calidus]
MSILLKYCGHRSLQDLQTSADSRAHYLGLIFAQSKRQVQPSEVKEWIKIVKLNKKKLVGVFVNASVSEIAHIAKEVPLSIIQCHGKETPEQIIQIKKATRLSVWKVIHHSEEALEQMKRFNGIADGYIIDSQVKGEWGGTGISFNWEFVPSYLLEAERQGVRCLIAGGVHPDNIEELLRYKPHGIDISSGIEDGEQKNKRKIQFIEEKVEKYESCS